MDAAARLPERSTDPVKVLVASAVRLYRDGLIQALAQRGRFAVSESGSDAADVLSRVESNRPDILLLDIAIPHAFQLTRLIAATRPECRVVALGISDTQQAVMECAEAGVRAFVPLEGSLDDLLRVIMGVMDGELHCSPAIAAGLLRRVGDLAARGPLRLTHLDLTPREQEILGLVEQGLSNREIATQLHIEVPTVKNHVHNILEKLRVRRRGEAAARMRMTLPRAATR